MTIGKKLMVGFTALLVVALGLAGAYLYSVASLGGALRTATDVTAKKVLLMTELEAQLFRLRSCQRGVMLFSLENLPEKAQSNKQEFETRAAAVETLMSQIKPLLSLERGRNDIATMESELTNFKGYFEQVAAKAMAGDAKGALQVYTEQSAKSLDSLEALARGLVERQEQLMRDSSLEGARASSQAHWTAYILLIAAVAIAPFVLIAIARTTRQLRGVAAGLADGAEQITSASSQVASSSQTLAQGASEQAASLEETSSSSEQITSMTRKNAENSQAAAGVMTEVDQRVAEGNRTLEEMLQSMREITGSSDKISKIIKVIDEIAFQTNILALNAAVEAARAGEAGMGFAVVADEVRSLAQRSAQAAKDTAALIEESITKSNEGSRRLEHVAQVIHAITESAAKVKTLVDEVNLGSQEQARGIEHISKSIAEMDRVTQSNAASAEQSASASEEMSAQAEALQNIARELQTLVGGGDGSEDRTTISAPSATSRRQAAIPSAPKTKDLAALRSAVSPGRSSAARNPAIGQQQIPLEGDFVKM
ncbi:MAG TPA: methyl-accepting chemotaxis protein [Bryobacteraceae bacterium]|nr:methyl-accepting chemotaxis protein [Bryobacteraceae bacterium]